MNPHQICLMRAHMWTRMMKGVRSDRRLSSLLQDDAALKTTTPMNFSHHSWHANADYVYAPGSPANWYWEATAVWMEQGVYPEATEHHRHLPSCLFFSELPLSYFPTELTGTLSDSHAYGTFHSFPCTYSKTFQARTSFVNRSPIPKNSDPLQVLDQLLQANDTDLKEIFLHSRRKWV